MLCENKTECPVYPSLCRHKATNELLLQFQMCNYNAALLLLPMKYQLSQQLGHCISSFHQQNFHATASFSVCEGNCKYFLYVFLIISRDGKVLSKFRLEISQQLLSGLADMKFCARMHGSRTEYILQSATADSCFLKMIHCHFLIEKIIVNNG